MAPSQSPFLSANASPGQKITTLTLKKQEESEENANGGGTTSNDMSAVTLNISRKAMEP